MSVIVMGVDLPEDCDSCWLPGKHCNLWLATDVGERHRGCPIYQLPEKHGRLIDADAYIEMMRKECDESAILDGMILKVCRGGVKALPTIVESEGDDASQET